MEIQCSSLKNETVIFIIPHTINTITIHVFKILSSIIPDYFQYSFDRDTMITYGSKSYFCFDHTITTTHFHTKINYTQLKYLKTKGFKKFRIKKNNII